jgi:bifunctional non-homologous end joining protein LigD
MRHALRHAKANEPVEIAGVTLTNPRKLLYPQDQITKHDVASYYEQIAEWILPHIVKRPLALVRCPAGHGKPCFFQKHPGEGLPAELKPINVSDTQAAEYHLSVDNTAGLIALAQMGVLEIHIWGSKIQRLEKSDRLTFDLDPDPRVEWNEVVRAAREIRLLLEELGLTAFLKTTGGKGLHLVVPLTPRVDWRLAKSFSKGVAEMIVRAAPERYVAKMSKAARAGKIFIDYLRNGRGATAIAPYSTRAKPGATVSMPLTWEELTPRIRSDHFTIQNTLARLRQLNRDPWEDFPKTRQTLTKSMQEMVEHL